MAGPSFDLVVVGAGHAGCEAAAAAARMGARVCVVTLSRWTVAQMPCNPAMGGIGKGHLIAELDALGGIQGWAADRSGIQFRVLNRSRGPAVWGPRAQCDKARYTELVRRLLEGLSGVTLVEGEVTGLVTNDAGVRGVRLDDGAVIEARAALLTTGTFLGGTLHTGDEVRPGGRFGERPSEGLGGELAALGLRLRRFKTGTPPRLSRRSIDFDQLDEQLGDEDPRPFSVGSPAEVEMFFSRRIGIGPGGEAIPILTGGRVSGAISDRTKVGLLNMQMKSVEGVAAANNFAVARVQHELPNRSAIGFLATNRNATGDLAGDSDYNRLFALDGRLGIGELTQLSGYVARSVSPDTSGGQYAYNLEGLYSSESWRLSAGYTEVASAFNPELGFLSRTSYRKISGSIFKSIRVGNFLGLHEIRPHTNYRAFFDFDGFQETGYWHIDSHWEWKTGHEIHTGLNFTREGVKDPFEISEDIVVPTGTYDHHEAAIVAFTNRGSFFSTGLRLVVGGIFGGDRVSTTNDIRFRLGETFTTEFSLNRNDITLPGGNFVTTLFRGRLSYSFTPRIYLQTLVQYNDQSEVWSANVRFGWLRDANTGLFVVYNQANDLVLGQREVQNRGLTVKYTHLIDVL